MSWFQLDPQSLAGRASASPVPSLGSSIRRGIIGFTLVSVAGFVPWAVLGKWFGGELAMYLACAVVFIILSGPLLHRLILGSGSLPRFYKLFGIAFTAYSIAWIAGWMTLRGHPGSLAGLLAGTAAMGWIIATAFEARGQALKIIAALFVLNAIGYFAGGEIEMALIERHAVPAMLLWGVAYGIGLGAGLGLAFHLAQTEARALLANSSGVRLPFG